MLAGLAVLAALVIFAAIGSSTNKSTPTSKTKHPPGAAKTAPADQAAAQRRAAAQARAQRRRALARQRVRLSLTAGTAVRVCLVNAAGKKVLSGVLTPLSKPKAQVSKRFRITIGIGALTLRWAGKTLRKPSGPGPLGYELDPGGKHKTLPASQRPVCP